MTYSLVFFVELSYFLAALMFVTGLRRMSSPSRARSGVWIAGTGMALAVAATFASPALAHNHVVILVAIAIGGGFAVARARVVATTHMPQMIAIFNSLGGLAAAGIADISRRHRFANRQVAYLANFAFLLMLGLLLSTSSTPHPVLLGLFFLLAMLFGVLMVLPIAATDLPVLISMFNALTGLSVSFEGFVMDNPVMLVAGTLVCAAGMLLTRLMARAVNRRLSEMMYSGFGISHDNITDVRPRSPLNDIDAFDAAMNLAYAERVVVVPGYGMAVAQAQHKLRELTQLLEERGVHAVFAIHPVAGRMPGHMNVLLAEAGVPYDRITDLAEINSEFPQVDVVLVVGANDIVNPAAQIDVKSPLYGMPVMDVAKAGSVIVLKRGDGSGYAGVDNPLLTTPTTRVLFGDAKESVQRLIGAIKSLD